MTKLEDDLHKSKEWFLAFPDQYPDKKIWYHHKLVFYQIKIVIGGVILIDHLEDYEIAAPARFSKRVYGPNVKLHTLEKEIARMMYLFNAEKTVDKI